MRELSLHILDIIQNSIKAGANLIEITIKENVKKNYFIIEISDNGEGMDAEVKSQVTDPFVTSRKTRNVGLGLSLLKAAVERCEGEMIIDSIPGKGTEVQAIFRYDHIDRAPLGDIVNTITGLIGSNPEIDLIYKHIYNENKFELNTKEIRKELENIRLTHTRVLNWIKNYLEENLKNIRGGE